MPLHSPGQDNKGKFQMKRPRQRMSRRHHDFYETPGYMTRALLALHPGIAGTVLECCAGDGSIATVLRHEAGLRVLTNDVDAMRLADYCLSAAEPELWAKQSADWVITNPPYQLPACLRIVDQAVKHARVGVAMMLRLSFKEPTRLRGPWLADHPIQREIVMPRYSFTGNGKSDNVTTAWMIWTRTPLPGAAHVSVFDAEKSFARPMSPVAAGRAASSVIST